jgi:hypothetical protein
MADTVDTAASSSSADEAETASDGRPASSVDGADGHEPEADATEKREGEAEEREEETEDGAAAPSLTELLEQLGRDLGELGVSEAQLEAARNMPEVRRAARDVTGTLIVVVTALTAFAFLNVAAMDGLSKVLATWIAALVLAAVWMIVAAVLLFGVMGRARRWVSWVVLKPPSDAAVDELERDRNAAGAAALSTLERVGPALAVQIALAAVPDAGDVASGVVEMGDNVLEVSDEIIEVVTEQIPGGSVVNQVWDVALMPGRLGIKVATTVLRRGRPGEAGVPTRAPDPTRRNP